VQEATGAMLARLDALQTELDGMLAALKRSGAVLEEGLAKLHADVGAAAPEAVEPVEPTEPVPQPPEPEAVPEPPVVAEVAPPAVENGGAADEAGARLIALNMALSGTPREETERYLAEHYDLPDAAALLDDVYKRAAS
jgi:hypothetical protein